MNLNEIIKNNKQNVKNIIRLITKEADNEDLEQEVYIKVWKNAEKYKEQGSFSAWIKTIAKNVSKVIPVIGGFACGGLTLATYKPMAEKLRKYLSTLKFADVEFYKDNDNIIASY